MSKESYKTKPLGFAFSDPPGSKRGAAAPDDEGTETTPDDEGAEGEARPAELGAAVNDAMKAGDGAATYEAICRIVEAHGKGG